MSLLAAVQPSIAEFQGQMPRILVVNDDKAKVSTPALAGRP
jgi:hypothetical protein